MKNLNKISKHLKDFKILQNFKRFSRFFTFPTNFKEFQNYYQKTLLQYAIIHSSLKNKIQIKKYYVWKNPPNKCMNFNSSFIYINGNESCEIKIYSQVKIVANKWIELFFDNGN